KRHAAELVGVQEARALLDEIEATAPALVRETVPRVVSVPVLADVLARLVGEGVSVRDLRAILGALVRAPQGEGVAALVERARPGLRRQITHQVTRGRGTLVALRFDDDIEEALREAVRPDDALALEPELGREIAGAVTSAAAAAGSWVLVTPAALRRHA